MDGASWDDSLVGESLFSWNKIMEVRLPIRAVKVPRSYYRNASQSLMNYQLDGFCDASFKAYSVVIYLRTEHVNGEVEVTRVPM